MNSKPPIEARADLAPPANTNEKAAKFAAFLFLEQYVILRLRTLHRHHRKECRATLRDALT